MYTSLSLKTQEDEKASNISGKNLSALYHMVRALRSQLYNYKNHLKGFHKLRFHGLYELQLNITRPYQRAHVVIILNSCSLRSPVFECQAV
jgi:hypothetical protein